MHLIQLLIDGVASGCIYGLVALGFVLIYKATETKKLYFCGCKSTSKQPFCDGTHSKK